MVAVQCNIGFWSESVLTDNLFQKVLVEPFERNSTLYIVSGYASATMVSRHFTALIGDNRRRAAFLRRRDVRIELIVGMARRDGILKHDHEGFQKFAHEYNGLFVCRYVVHGAPIHSKTFGWYRGDNTPAIGFTGSANYTQGGFSNSQRESMVEHDAEEARAYFDIVMQDTIDCRDETAEDRVRIYTGRRRDERDVIEEDRENFSDSIEGLPHRRTTLLTRSGGIHRAGGLNWGQRPGREPNQAYIALRAAIYKTDFFPPIGEPFTVITDDGMRMICSRAQQNGKAIHTPDSNSLLGNYFRNRIGVNPGDAVSLEDLGRYGRTDVDFYKLDEETYFMDFSVGKSDG